MSNFSGRQLSKLCQEVDASLVQKRRVGEKELSYLPGWFVVSEANAIFGYGSWDRQTVQIERLFERMRAESFSCGYLARVRITVRAGDQEIVRDGTGVGHASATNLADAHERAIKGAETDATKRALVTFGSRFGLSLYRPRAVNLTFALLGPKGDPHVEHLSAAAFAGGLRQMICLSRTELELSQLMETNRASVEALRTFPNLQSGSGRHYADILLALAEKRRQTLSEGAPRREPDTETVPCPTAAQPDPVGHEDTQGKARANTDELKQATHGGPATSVGHIMNDAPLLTGEPAGITESMSAQAISLPSPARSRPGWQIDKSVLRYANDRRIRNKDHLQFVASQPCLVCEQIPSHAHHITFAQPRGLSLKVSDEFTVPLCALHHNSVHHSTPEKSWWNNLALDPVETAADLWQQTLQRLITQAENKTATSVL